jgi:hypothetical protein
LAAAFPPVALVVALPPAPPEPPGPVPEPEPPPELGAGFSSSPKIWSPTHLPVPPAGLVQRRSDARDVDQTGVHDVGIVGEVRLTTRLGTGERRACSFSAIVCLCFHADPRRRHPAASNMYKAGNDTSPVDKTRP